MKRMASAQWRGDLKSGNGTLTAPSGVFSATPYSFRTRFEDAPGTNPEELLAAAHAGCFSMALSAQLAGASLTAESIETTCTLTFEKTSDGFAITESHLDLKATVPGATPEAFERAVNAAKTGCPVSKLFNTKITLESKLA